MRGGDERAVRSAKATVPFLARFTGQGLESGDGNPSNVRFKVNGRPGPHWLDAVSVTVNVPGLIGTPETIPVFGSIDRPWGSQFALKLVARWFVLNGPQENGLPVFAAGGLLTDGSKSGA
jgi:hypothetical protein